MRHCKPRRLVLAVAALTLFASLAELGGDSAGQALAASALERLKSRFQRPDAVPFPPENPFSLAKAALGRRLFHDPGLSSSGILSCAGCHVESLGFEDGRVKALGHDGAPLTRHTPTLWNLAWGETFFWDGRAESLEAQARMPIESTAEMNRSMADLISALEGDKSYSADFAAAFPQDPTISEENLLAALATYVRTLATPPSRFDAWVSGDEDALGMEEIQGFLLFNGRARCAECHGGWNFTDQAFHDIGLPDGDPGRGAVLEIDELDHAFKTPTLRDISRRAPYMHDGSLATLSAVLDHYVSGIAARETLSPDLKPISLDEPEKAQLIAFLKTLEAGPPPEPADIATTLAERGPAGAEAAVETRSVSQRDGRFDPGRIRLAIGETLRIRNDDTRAHNVRINHAELRVNSGIQEPGETVSVSFPAAGTYHVICGIHPTMRLVVEAR